MSCPLHIALALAEEQMCPALPRGKWYQATESISLGCMAEAGRQRRVPRTTRRGEVLNMVLQKKIRTGKEVSYEAYAANPGP